MTVTLRDVDSDEFASNARGLGLRVQLVKGVQGRFHTAAHKHNVDKLMRMVQRQKELQFPPPQGLVRSTIDGAVISQLRDGDEAFQSTRLVLESVLVSTADWYATLKASIQSMMSATANKKTTVVAVAGLESILPASVVQSFRVLPLGKLLQGKASKVNGTNGINGTNGTSGAHIEQEIHIATADDGDLSQYSPHSVAIVGMAGRFPGADSVDELWELLAAGKSTAEAAPVERLGLPRTGEHAQTRWWGNFLRDPTAFDHRFFGKSSREAAAWDPQQRVMLEVVYEALEAAGHFGPAPRRSAQPTDFGVYVGAVLSNYYDNLSCHPATAYATQGTTRCFVSGSVSHYFGWTGPALTIDTACSSSLVALNAACRAIRSGECSRAVAGGANVISSPFDYRNFAAAGFLSPTGQCKPFDEAADGYCRGEGVAAVVLKRLDDALRDGDTVHGVVVGSAANQNHNASHITVPQPESQVALYRDVMRQGGVAPGDVSYVEAHGTGTQVGDPVEVRSIRRAFGGPAREDTLHFGSVKGNIGHTEATAGVAGLVKVLLMLRHRRIPPQASHTKLNPKLGPPLEDDKMAIPQSLVDWQAGPGLRRVACVNSYGAAGSNSAALIRQGPAQLTPAASLVQLAKYPLVISANSANSLARYCKKLLGWLKKEAAASTAPDALLSSLTFNLADRANLVLPFRLATTVTSLDDLQEKLTAAAAGTDSDTTSPPPPPSQSKPVAVLVFGGQESNFIGLSEVSYHTSKVFRRHLDACNDLLLSEGRTGLFPTVFQREPVQRLAALHAGLFAVQYASAASWLDSGLEVGAVVGHSFGQLTALCVSGVLSLADALRLVVVRAEIMEKHWGLERGTMLSVRADRETVEQALGPLQGNEYAEIACYNGPESHVVVGSAGTIQLLEKHFSESSIRTKRLDVTHGFHSKFTEPMLEHISALAKELEWRRPAIHLETCDEVQRQTDPDSEMVASHTRRPVFFQHAIERLATRFPQGTCAWLEAGRGSSVMQLVRGCVAGSKQSQPLFLSPQLASTSTDALASLADSTVELWRRGLAVQYWAFHRSQKPEFGYLSLPPYQFEKTRHWLPFTGREPEVSEKGVEAKSAHLQGGEGAHETQELLTIRHRADDEAVFRVHPQSDRFQAVVGGHVMSGQALAPASLYFELVARAALFLADDVAATMYVPVVDDLTMMSPIGRDTGTEITMKLKRRTEDNGDGGPAWSFSFATRQVSSSSASVANPAAEKSTGTVLLRRRSDDRAARAFARLEALAGHGRRVAELLASPDGESMRGRRTIYQAFSAVCDYGPSFQRLNHVSCVGREAAATVRVTPDTSAPADQRLCDAHTADVLMQAAGLLANYFNNASAEHILVCNNIERIEVGGGFNPAAGEWRVLATLTSGGEDVGGHEVVKEASADLYVFDARTDRMVMAFSGFRFSRMPRALLARLLQGVNKTDAGATSSVSASDALVQGAHVTDPSVTTASASKKAKSAGPSKRQELLRILASVTDRPIGEIMGEATLDDLGIDSLMATEVLNDIRTGLGLTIDLSTFFFFADVNALAQYVDEQLGLGGAAGDTGNGDVGEDIDDGSNPSAVAASLADSGIADVGSSGTTSPPAEKPTAVKIARPAMPALSNALDAFRETRLNYDDLARDAQALGFWTDAYPQQKRLVLAYVVEAFARLGCDLAALQAGETVPRVQGTLDRHARLVRQFFRILEDGGLIQGSSSSLTPSFTRTAAALDLAPAEAVFHDIIDLHPPHATVNKLVRAVGSELAACLTGEKDALQILFGDPATKAVLEDAYDRWPLFRAPGWVLGDFVERALTAKSSASTGNGSGGKFRILEVGAGTGGTTKVVVERLRSLGVPFEYVFTDISASLVSTAAKRAEFADLAGDGKMCFKVLDIEQPPKPEDVAAYHIVLASNAIHATSDLGTSLRHLRAMLSDDGALTLLEITRNMSWLDVVFGPLEGWWRFEDGRSHAIVDERHWKRVMKAAGFAAVEWSDGESPESKTVRLIGAFPTAPKTTTPGGGAARKPEGYGAKALMETVVYKKVGDLEIHADVYWPVADGPPDPKPRPVALMVHGGSHIIYSRKDVRPAQTRLLLARGFLPVSVDYRLCPELTLADGPMADVCSALAWARDILPGLDSPARPAGVVVDGARVAAIGWSSGGMLALSLAWTAPARGLPPPTAVLGFYCPTDYTDKWWTTPIDIPGAASSGLAFDVLEGVHDAPLTSYGVIGAHAALPDPRILEDARCRMILHMNWKAQTLPVIVDGLPTRAAANRDDEAAGAGRVTDWNAAPQPDLDRVRAVSPRAHVEAGTYAPVPTFLVHGTGDDLIPWRQSQDTYDVLVARGVPAGLALVDGAAHICDRSSDPESDGWKAVLKAYTFLSKYVL